MENHILFLYRICNSLHQKAYKRKTIKWLFSRIVIRIFYGYYSKLLSFFYGAYLPYTAKIGINLKLNHSFHGIFISENAVIGDNCTIVQHTTIGSNQPLSSDAPNIGNNVFIGANCCIVGKTVIGNNTIIGAGVVISNSTIPENSKVVGQKFRIL
jgi:serine O-acetyltransferase